MLTNLAFPPAVGGINFIYHRDNMRILQRTGVGNKNIIMTIMTTQQVTTGAAFISRNRWGEPSKESRCLLQAGRHLSLTSSGLRRGPSLPPCGCRGRERVRREGFPSAEMGPPPPPQNMCPRCPEEEPGKCVLIWAERNDGMRDNKKGTDTKTE